jgi:carboxymethylenebutenolidase
MPSLRLIVGSCAVVTLAVSAAHYRPASATPAMDDHMAQMAPGDLALPATAPSAQQGDLAYPASATHTAARLAASPRHSEWVKVPVGAGSTDSVMAWIVYPETSNAHTPVVVVIHEIFGLSGWVRGVADQVAAQGFIAIAPDLNSRIRGGPTADSLPSDSAVKLANLVPPAERNRYIDAVARYAMSQPSAEQRYAVIGFCYGGSTVWDHTISRGVAGFSGGVAFYGTPYMKRDAATNTSTVDRDSLARIEKPIMLLSGSKDQRISAAMPGIDTAMKALGKWYYGENYPGAVHGFMRAQDDPKAKRDEAEEQANMAAVHDGWPRTIAFLKKNLGVK